MNEVRVGKTISYALRHNPKKYGLSPDEEGFVRIDDLIDGLFNVEKIEISVMDIERIIENSEKKRYEIQGDLIRATYGHSTVKVVKEEKIPPHVLYHGTTHKAYKKIVVEGLKPMERQYVHLSMDEKTAMIVGKRRESNPLILEIDAYQAYLDGVKFYHGNDTTWLSEPIGNMYIKVKNKM